MAKILVVEDDKFLASAYRAKLTKEGFEIMMAGDGEEALQILQTFVPDLMLLDLVMPKKDGFAVLTEMSQHPNLKVIPVIVTSNLGQKEDLDKAMGLGATDYIIKSDMTMEALVERINATLAKKAQSVPAAAPVPAAPAPGPQPAPAPSAQPTAQDSTQDPESGAPPLQ